jgi:hypothetical protein
MPRECAELLAAYEKLASCPQLPKDSADQVHAAIEAMKPGWDTADQAHLDDSAVACKTAETTAHQSMQAIGCE